MRSLTRLPEPAIITTRGNQWLIDLIASGKLRPDSSKYANPQIRTQLDSISFHKCFYCETKLKNSPKEVDHNVEVSVNINLSFVWNNLYLCCDNCNNKLNHIAIPINTTLDPFLNNDIEIEEHLTFIDEQVTARSNSPIGINTIRKYRLDTELLDKRRINQLKNFLKLLNVIRQNQISDGGRAMTQNEIDSINIFKQIDQPYSLMFKILANNL
jgi:5-methylcytosine-specific restriction endonuclease McrA